ncbi:hypothetical protein GCM10012275_05370 [Longimycelium tulufanense]|uniref:Uncharacterized protein n=1 Tax=Longimycelium tulufanense TaxID=907463 RepID=A0A8J3FSL9_9PSEU|nr:hypothetical protein [Longimycelium tulufanense]GGM37152.1 hypothetical protein GCM10012275_05370 [Longimycelium tulufanense]
MLTEGDRCRLAKDLPLTEDCWLPAGLEGTVQAAERVVVFGIPPLGEEAPVRVGSADEWTLRRAEYPELRADVQCRVRLDTGGVVTVWAQDHLQRL